MSATNPSPIATAIIREMLVVTTMHLLESRFRGYFCKEGAVDRRPRVMVACNRSSRLRIESLEEAVGSALLLSGNNRIAATSRWFVCRVCSICGDGIRRPCIVHVDELSTSMSYTNC